MKKYITPTTESTPVAYEGFIAWTVGGPDDGFSPRTNDWEEGLEQGVRGQKRPQSPSWKGIMERDEW